MRSLLVRRCSYVITQDSERRVLKDISIYVEDGVIAELGKATCEAEVKLNGEGMLVLPGLVNAHTHAAMTLLRGYADDLPLKQWLEQKIWPLERRLTYDYCYWGALLACLEMVKFGSTCFMDMYFYPEATAAAANTVGLRAVVSYGMFDFKDPTIAQEQLKGARRFLEKASELRDRGIVLALGPHAPYTCSDELLVGAVELARKNGALIHMHVAETAEEVKSFKEEKGMSEVEYLDGLGVLGPDVVAAHCVWLSDRDVEVLARRGVKVVHCPTSNLKLASGIAPIPKLLSKGITIALGTDGAASNNSLNMFGSMKLTALIHKAYLQNPTILPAQIVLDMATINGAETLGLNAGKIVEGALADFSLLNLKRPSFTPIHDFSSLTSHVVYASDGVEVSSVVVGGRVVLHRGKPTFVKEEDVLVKAEEAARSLVKAKSQSPS